MNELSVNCAAIAKAKEFAHCQVLTPARHGQLAERVRLTCPRVSQEHDVRLREVRGDPPLGSPIALMLLRVNLANNTVHGNPKSFMYALS
jgi:hypothetical protein